MDKDVNMLRNEDFLDEEDFDYTKIDATFFKYANFKEDKHLCGESGRIGPNGMQKFLKDIGVLPDSITALILAWKFRAEVPCEFSQKEFRRGFRDLYVQTVAQLKAKANKLVELLHNRACLADLYRFTFNYVKIASNRYLDVDTAIRYWKLILDPFFSNELDNRLQMWYMFLQFMQIKTISKDTWNLFLVFLWETDRTLSNYDFDAGPWPVLIDDFVQYVHQYSKPALDVPMEQV